MFRNFFPTVYYESPYIIDFEALYQKGYRSLLTDVDNTLVRHGAPSDRRSEAFFEKLHRTGWKTCVISNNNKERVAPFAEKNRCLYICDAGKPGTKGYFQGMEMMGSDLSDTVFMGDQLFTDIYGANRAGMKSILVKPVHLDKKPFILLKRLGELIVKRFYFRYAKKHPGSL